MKITAAVFRDKLTPELEELELSGPRDDEVLVKIVATGVCHTDLKSAKPGGRSPAQSFSALKAQVSSRRSGQASSTWRPAITS